MTKTTLALLLLVAGAALGCSRQSAVFEIPNGYVGWVIVHQGVVDCPSEKANLFASTIRVQSNGTACSHVWNSNGLNFQRAYYVDPGGKRLRRLHSTRWGEGGEIWGDASILGKNTMYFFVGSEEVFRATKTRPSQ